MNNGVNHFVAMHGARVRRGKAMELLCITDEEAFYKVVDANPHMRHRIKGESQSKYLTSVIYELITPKCATEGEDRKPKR